MSDKKSIGQIVDLVADRYFASGMDAFSAGIRACIDVAYVQASFLSKGVKALDGLLNRLASESGDQDD